MNLNDNTHLEYSQTTSIVTVNRLKFTSARYVKCFALKVIAIIWSGTNDATMTAEQLPSTNSYICVHCELIDRSSTRC